MSRPTPSDSSPITVSIITPCYNGAPFIGETLRSVLAQTRPPLEVIVIDDGSTDESASIAEAFGPPVRVIRQTNHGESFARNRGVDEARGSHVLFLDADDLLAPRALEELTHALAGRPRSVALMGCARFTEDPARPTSITPPQHERFFPDIIETNFGPPLTWMTTLAIIREVHGFSDDIQWSEDWDILWRIGLIAEGVVPVPYVGALYRIHAKSQFATNSMANRCRGHATIMTRMIGAFLQRHDLLSAHGERLFWGGWIALGRARAQNVSWAELQPLTDALHTLASDGPPDVRKLTTARMLRLLGAKVALALKRVS